MNAIAESKHQAIAGVAASVFLSKGIEEATIKEIAVKVGIGEATIYRHYKTKAQLAILAADYLQQTIFAEYFASPMRNTGFASMQAFYGVFSKVFENHPEYYRFLDEFDIFISNEAQGDKYNYEAGLNRFKDIYISLYKQGLQDGTVNEIEDIDVFYFASTHATLSLCKKLADKSVLSQDLSIDKSKELKVFIETVLYRLKKI